MAKRRPLTVTEDGLLGRHKTTGPRVRRTSPSNHAYHSAKKRFSPPGAKPRWGSTQRTPCFFGSRHAGVVVRLVKASADAEVWMLNSGYVSIGISDTWSMFGTVLKYISPELAGKLGRISRSAIKPFLTLC